MSLLLDLSDERRGSKPWLPEDDRDVTNGLVRPDHRVSWDGKPVCSIHGAMNQIAPSAEDEGRIYRCQSERCGVGALWYPTNSRVSKATVSKAWDEKYEESF